MPPLCQNAREYVHLKSGKAQKELNFEEVSIVLAV